MPFPDLTGTSIPDVTLRFREDAQWVDRSTTELFSGRKVVVFALPGAFTPTCSASHVPRYNQLTPEFNELGVDAVACLSVNDAFVMNAWQEDQDAFELLFLPDGNGELTRKLGMLVDKSHLGFGERSWRYSMLVEDGVITKAFVEPEGDGDPFDVSDADTMLAYLGGKAPADVVLYTRPECIWCHRAIALLDERGISYHEISATPGLLKATSGRSTTPQVFIDGEHIGGFEDLKAHLGDG